MRTLGTFFELFLDSFLPEFFFSEFFFAIMLPSSVQV
jgi:hypothetical protein